MKCTILHESRGRLRVHVCNVRMTLHRADVLEAYLNHHDAVSKAKVYERTGDVVVYYTGTRKDAVAALSTYRFDDPELDALVTSADSRRINQEYQEKMYNLVAGRVLRKLFLPAPLNAAYTVFRSIEFLWKGVCCLWRRKLEVEVLDALSIGVSILRGDFATAGSVMFLLNVGSLLEEWTRKKSLDDLARSMALNVDKVWVRAQGTEVLMPLTKVHPGDEIAGVIHHHIARPLVDLGLAHGVVVVQIGFQHIGPVQGHPHIADVYPQTAAALMKNSTFHIRISSAYCKK